jgi:hypothetical protein
MRIDHTNIQSKDLSGGNKTHNFLVDLLRDKIYYTRMVEGRDMHTHRECVCEERTRHREKERETEGSPY